MSEALFVGGYAFLMLVVAVLFEWTARASHERIHRTKTIGFRYHGHLDAWQCSEGTYLWRRETDASARIVLYSAKAETCNVCPLKAVCTDSSEGRTLVRPLDGWPHSEMARFQRVFSLSLMILATLFCLVELARQPDAMTKMTFAAGTLLCALLARREWRRVRAVKTALFS